jgi:hypothetical protein
VIKFALNLAEDGRILSACVVLPNGNYEGMPIVDELPNGNIYEYRYVDGEYILDPLPEPEQPEPAPSGDSVWDELDAAYQAGYHEGYTEGVNSAYDQ